MTEQEAGARRLNKAWRLEITHDDGDLVIVHADTEEDAVARIAAQIGEEPKYVGVERVPEMDGLDITAWNLLTTGACGWHGCEGCHLHIYPDDGNDWGGPYSIDEGGDEVPAVQGPRGSAYCSAACMERAA